MTDMGRRAAIAILGAVAPRIADGKHAAEALAQELDSVMIRCYNSEIPGSIKTDAALRLVMRNAQEAVRKMFDAGLGDVPDLKRFSENIDTWMEANIPVPPPTRFRKKLVIVDAVQWHGFEKGPHDLGVVLCRFSGRDGGAGWLNSSIGVGVGRISPGDWILTDAEGGKSIKRSADFEQTYEPVDNEDTD